MHRNCVLKRTGVGMAMLVICVLWGAGPSAWATDHHKKVKPCSNQTLSGDYGTLIEGTILGPNLTLRTLTLVHYDGQGGFTGKDFVVVGGNPPAEEWRPSSGTYSVNPDCTGSATVDVAPGSPPLGYHFIIVDDGRKILLVVNGSAIRGIAHRVDDDDDD
jgi:hypothetical protein